jgi:hypothetical protein
MSHIPFVHCMLVTCVLLPSLQLRSIVQSLSANKADSSTLLQHQQQCEQQLLELRKGQAAAHSTAREAAAAASAARRAVEPVESMRLEMADMQGCVAAIQAATAGGWRHDAW